MKSGKKYPKGLVSADCWVKVYDNTLGTAATSVTISGLTGNTDKEYKLEARIVNGYNGAVAYGIRPNNDTGTNYGRQYLQGENGTAYAGRGTRTLLDLNYAYALADKTFSETTIYAKSGYVRTAISTQVRGVATTTVNDLMLMGQSWNNTADEITSLVVLADQTNGLGVGTQIVLWKKAFHS